MMSEAVLLAIFKAILVLARAVYPNEMNNPAVKPYHLFGLGDIAGICTKHIEELENAPRPR